MKNFQINLIFHVFEIETRYNRNCVKRYLQATCLYNLFHRYLKPIALYLKDAVDSFMKYYVYTQLISAYIVSIRNDVVVMGIDSKLAVTRGDRLHGNREISARFIASIVNDLCRNSIYI